MAEIRYDLGDQRFNYRTVGILRHGGQVLLHRAEEDDFWTLPGGRVELGEPADQALRRELLEELGLETRIERLVWAVENFFTHRGLRYHELSFYFLVAVCEPVPRIMGQESFRVRADEANLIFEWFPLGSLENVALKPSFLQRGLSVMPETTQYLVHEDPDSAARRP